MEPLPLIPYETLEERVEALHRDGYVYLPGVLSVDAVDELRSRMGDLTAIPESFDKHRDTDGHGFLNKSINNTFNHHPHFLQYLDIPDVSES